MKNMIINRPTCGGPKKGGLAPNSGAYYGQWFMKRRATKRVDKKKYPKVCRGERKHKLTLAELILYFMVHGEKHPDMNQRNPDISKMRAEIEKSLILNNGLTLDQLNRAKSFNEGFKRGNTNQIKEVLNEVIELWGIYMIDPKGSRIGKRIGKIRNLGAKHGPCSDPTSSSVNLDDPPSSPPWPGCLACVNKTYYPGNTIAAQQKSCCDSNCDACNMGQIDGEIVNDFIQPMLSRFICVVIYTLWWIMNAFPLPAAVAAACETCGLAGIMEALFYFVKEFLYNLAYDLVEWMIDELVYVLAHNIMSKSAETVQVIADCIVHVVMWYLNNVATGTGPVSDFSEFLSQIIIDTICGEGAAGFLCDTQPELAFASEGQDCKKNFNENAEPPPSFGDKMCSPLAPRCRVTDNICTPGTDGKYFKGSEKLKFSGEFLLFRHPDKPPITCGRVPNINTIFAGYEVNLGYCGPYQPVPTPAVEDAWVSPKAIWDGPCPYWWPDCGSRPDWIWDYATRGAMNDSYGENMLCKDFNNDPENCGGCNIKCSDSDMECSYGHCIGCPGHCDYARGWMCLPDQGLCMTYSNTDPPAPPVIPEDQEQFYINSDNLAPQPDTDNAKKLRSYIGCDSTQNDPHTGLSTECNKKVGQKHPMTCQQVCPGGSCIGPVDAALFNDGDEFTGKCVPNSIHEKSGTCNNNKCNYSIPGTDGQIFHSDTSCTTDPSCNVWVSGFHGICTQAFKGCVGIGPEHYVYSDICHAAGLISEEQCTHTESCHWIDQCTKLVDTYPLCGLCSEGDMPSPTVGLHGCVDESVIGDEPYVWGYDQLEPCGRRYHCGLISQVDIDGITYPVGQCVGPHP